jgi:hypothetical protein
MEAAIEAQQNVRFRCCSKEKTRGATFTPKNLADFVSKQMLGAVSDLSLRKALSIFDPAVGEGALLLSLLGELKIRGFDGELNAYGFDTDAETLCCAEAKIKQTFPKVKLNLEQSDFLDSFPNNENFNNFMDCLFSYEKPRQYDLIIANPPYVRTQVLGAERAQQLAARFGLRGRVDLYHAFIVAMTKVLKNGGVCGLIVSNRFMTTKSGKTLRHLIPEYFDVLHIWDMGDTKLFDAAVLPAVLLLKMKTGQNQKLPDMTSIYSTKETAFLKADDVIEALSLEGVVALNDSRTFIIKKGKLNPQHYVSGDVWTLTSDTDKQWLKTVELNTWCRFKDIGKIRVGVKTCADKVFIKKNWMNEDDETRPELLRPLLTHHSANRFRSCFNEKNGRYILYPEVTVGGVRKAVELEQFPNTKIYLEKNRSILESRDYLINSGKKWFELWVPHNPDDWQFSKLVFRDISEKPVFWVDKEGCVVNGDCYWLTLYPEISEDLLWLALAVGNSSFIEKFYDFRFNNKLYAGRRRFISQYVEQFPLPNPQLKISEEIIKFSKQMYCKPNDIETEKRLDSLIWKSFGVTSVEKV